MLSFKAIKIIDPHEGSLSPLEEIKTLDYHEGSLSPFEATKIIRHLRGILALLGDNQNVGP